MPKPHGPRTVRNKLGRKTKLTAAVRVALVNSYRNGLSQTAACARAGISANTFMLWRNRAADGEAQFIELFGQIESAEADFEEELVNTVLSAAKEPQVEMRIVEKLDGAGNVIERIREQRKSPPNWQAAFKALERLLPQRWGNRSSLSVDVNAKTEHTETRRTEVDWRVAVGQLSDAELEMLESAQAKLLPLLQAESGQDKAGVVIDAVQTKAKRAPRKRKTAAAQKNKPLQRELC